MLIFFLHIAQIILSVLLVAVILLQQKGTGLGGAFGGTSNVFSAKRGVDKVLFQATIALSILFFLTAIVTLLI
jgi:preprotein translocase subunit SecG